MSASGHDKSLRQLLTNGVSRRHSGHWLGRKAALILRQGSKPEGPRRVSGSVAERDESPARVSARRPFLARCGWAATSTPILKPSSNPCLQV
jgi:hypothetical protein